MNLSTILGILLVQSLVFIFVVAFTTTNTSPYLQRVTINGFVGRRTRIRNQGMLTCSRKCERIKQRNVGCWMLNGDGENDDINEPFFTIRRADFVDMGPASRILTDAFYAKKTNIFTYPIERLNTFLSLESTFPPQYLQSYRPPVRYYYEDEDEDEDEYEDEGDHEMFVACRNSDGLVLGFAELECRNATITEMRQSRNVAPINKPRPSSVPTSCPRPYMYNVAVGTKWQRMGVATALVKVCEDVVLEQRQSKKGRRRRRKRVFLKVREGNEAALKMYEKMGYETISTEIDDKNGECFFLMRKYLEEKEGSTENVSNGKEESRNEISQ